MAVDSLTSVFFFIVSVKCNCLKKQGHIINATKLCELCKTAHEMWFELYPSNN